MDWSKDSSAQPCRLLSSGKLASPFCSPRTPFLDIFEPRESHALLPPAADSSNSSPLGLASRPTSRPSHCASSLELPPLPGMVPILPFRDVVPYHLLSPDHPLNVPPHWWPHRSSPPAESFDDASTFSQARVCNSVSPVEPPLRCIELRLLSESDTETTDDSSVGTSEMPQVHEPRCFKSQLQHYDLGVYPTALPVLQSDSKPVQINQDSRRIPISGVLNPTPTPVKIPSPVAATRDSRMCLDSIINNHPQTPAKGPANKPVHQHKVYQNNVDLGHKENLGDYQDAHQLPPCNASKATKHSRMW